jgi:hypothetical protein
LSVENRFMVVCKDCDKVSRTDVLNIEASLSVLMGILIVFVLL